MLSKAQLEGIINELSNAGYNESSELVRDYIEAQEKLIEQMAEPLLEVMALTHRDFESAEHWIDALRGMIYNSLEAYRYWEEQADAESTEVP